MERYVLLIRGINVGGRNKVPMADLAAALKEAGFSQVITYIASGNVLVSSDRPAAAVRAQVEELLPQRFALDDDQVKVLVLTHADLQSVVDRKPPGFGEQPKVYNSDAIFLIDVDADTAMEVFDPRPEVDAVWPGDGVIYSQRVTALRTKSRLGKIVGTGPYRSMTIRSWGTVTKLLELLDEADGT